MESVNLNTFPLPLEIKYSANMNISAGYLSRSERRANNANVVGSSPTLATDNKPG